MNVKSLLAVTTAGVLSVAVCDEAYEVAVRKHYHVELAGPVHTVDAVRYTVSGYNDAQSYGARYAWGLTFLGSGADGVSCLMPGRG